jgi:hypothetical protein
MSGTGLSAPGLTITATTFSGNAATATTAGTTTGNAATATTAGTTTGNAGSVTNGVYTNAAATISSRYTFSGANNGIRLESNAALTMPLSSNTPSFSSYKYVTPNGQLSTSDRRLKRKLAPVDDALNKVMSIRGVYFNWVDNDNYIKAGLIPQDYEKRSRRQIGLIAQDIQTTIPELVETIGDNDEFLGVNYQSITALLIEAIKEVNERLEMLEKDVEEMKNGE